MPSIGPCLLNEFASINNLSSRVNDPRVAFAILRA